MSATQIICVKCKLPRDADAYLPFTKGLRKGQLNDACSACIAKRKAKAVKKRSEKRLPTSRMQEELPIQSFEDFVSSLGTMGVCDVRARVDVDAVLVH